MGSRAKKIELGNVDVAGWLRFRDGSKIDKMNPIDVGQIRLYSAPGGRFFVLSRAPSANLAESDHNLRGYEVMAVFLPDGEI